MPTKLIQLRNNDGDFGAADSGFMKIKF